MARPRRLWMPDAGAHSISRFVDRRFYLADDQDRRELLESIERANGRWDWRWLSWALMSSHVHYGHVAGRRDPDRFFRSTHTRYAQRFHRRRPEQTLGPVFASRPAIHRVREAALPRMVAYHHRNPVSAGIVERPSESTWTSHRVYLRLDPAPSWFEVERALDTLGFADTDAGRRRFDQFVMEVDLAQWSSDVPCQEAEPCITHGADDLAWPRLIALAREAANVPDHEPLTSRRRVIARARLLIALVATRDYAQPYAAVAREIGISSGSVFNLIRRSPLTTALRDDLEWIRERMPAQ